MEQLKIGQSLTPEQVRDLPDGAVVTVTDKAGRGTELKLYDSSQDRLSYALRTGGWSIATLVSLPSIEPKANDNLISEKLAQSPESESEPSPGEGYRWVKQSEQVLASDEHKVSGGWVSEPFYGVEVAYPSGDYVYRRRIEPQLCPSHGQSRTSECLQCEVEMGRNYTKASEIEKDCALHGLAVLFEDCHDAMKDAMEERDYGHLYDFLKAVEFTANKYREVYDYARSIGAIE